MDKIKSQNSLYKFLTIRVTVIVLIMFFILSVLSSFLFWTYLGSERRKSIEFIAATISKSVLRPLSTGEYSIAESYLSSSMFPSFISKVFIRTSSGQDVVKVINLNSQGGCEVLDEYVTPIAGGGNASDSHVIVLKLNDCGFIKNNILSISVTLLVCSLFAGIIIFLVQTGLKKSFLNLESLVRVGLRGGEISKELEKTVPVEVFPLLMALDQAYKQINEQHTATELASVAKQVAHDIRSPLGALQIALQTIAGGEKKSAELLMSRAIDRIRNIADDLLMSSPNDIKNSCEVFQASKAIEQIISELDGSNGEAKIKLKIEKDLIIKGSKSHFQRAVNNFLNNAIEARMPNRPLNIEIEVYENKIVIKDNGVGMDKNMLERLTTGNAETTKAYGFGLGFKGATKMLSLMNLSVIVLSTLNDGTEVIIKTDKLVETNRKVT